MATLVYWLAWAGIATLQAFPLRLVARVGRWGGQMAYFLDAKHRRIALENLQATFGREKTMSELRGLAREHFRRLGENYASAIKTASLPAESLASHLTVIGEDKIADEPGNKKSRVFAVGHFGNFELYARMSVRRKGYQFATTYRGLNQPKLNRLLQRLRSQSGCLFFDRRGESAQLREAMTRGTTYLGLLSDQHAGGGGAWIPFLGRICSTNTSAAVFAQRYKLPLHTAICFRTGLAMWRIELGDEIPVFDEQERRRSPADIMLDVNRVFEAAVRRDPANWFWVHNRWKEKKRKPTRRRRHNGERAASSPL